MGGLGQSELGFVVSGGGCQARNQHDSKSLKESNYSGRGGKGRARQGGLRRTAGHGQQITALHFPAAGTEQASTTGVYGATLLMTTFPEPI